MGIIIIKLKITNYGDEAASKRGFITPKEVRSIELTDVLVDTGSYYLGLPKKVVKKLGLDFVEHRNIKTAKGVLKCGLYFGAKLQLGDRLATVDTIALPDGTPPLLGVLAMEALGVTANPVKQIVEYLPIDPENTYMFAYRSNP